MKGWRKYPVIYEINTWVWLSELSRTYGKPVTLATVPDQQWDALAMHGFDAVWFDSMGNTVGKIGSGPRTILFDSHIDTVGIGDPAEWEWDPFQGKIEDGRFYARGACDEKGSTPGMIHGMALARDLGLLDGWTAWSTGNMEEWMDGIAALGSPS